MTSELLGFTVFAYNVVYAQMQRGQMGKSVLFGLAAVATTLGRLAADVCLFACGNFGFVHLPDKYTTGSSIMPHKKNPEIFELIRAKCNHLQSADADGGGVHKPYFRLFSGYAICKKNFSYFSSKN